jgi:hypothetical protein
MQNEAAVTCFKVTARHLSEGTDKPWKTSVRLDSLLSEYKSLQIKYRSILIKSKLLLLIYQSHVDYDEAPGVEKGAWHTLLGEGYH